MNVHFEDTDYEFDLSNMTVAQAKVIKVHCGMGLKGLSDGINDGDPDALRAVYWLMQVQTGLVSNIDRVDFVVVKFLDALAEASKAETEAAAEVADEDAPKE
jgi:hypothetical protein